MSGNPNFIRREKQLTIFVNVLGIISFISTFIDAIPQEFKGNLIFKIVAIFLIVSGAILVFPFIRALFKYNSIFEKFVGFGFVFMVFSAMFFTVFKQNVSEEKPKLLAIDNSSKVNQNLSHIKTESRNISLQSSNKNHIINGNDNVVGVNGDVTYNVNKPLQRKLNKKDLNQILSSVSSKDIRVRVNYPSNNKEALNFGEQIFDTLSKLGYINLSKGEIGMSMGYFGSGRITVRKDSLPIPVITLNVNSQQ